MADHPSDEIPPHEVERRLRELEELYELGMALKEVRFADPALEDRVRERREPPDGGASGAPVTKPAS